MDTSPQRGTGWLSCFNAVKCCRTYQALQDDEEVPLDQENAEPPPPSLPKLVLLGQFGQQMAIFGFGMNTWNMVSGYANNYSCNVTLDDSMGNYSCNVEESSVLPAYFPLILTIGCILLFAISFGSTYVLTDRFLKSVEYKQK